MNLVERMEAAPGAAFDYEQLDDAAANQAKAVVERYRGRVKAYVIDTGRDLLAVKERLDHGLFLEWVTSEMGLTSRTAQNFMQAAAQLGHKSEIVSHLPPTVLCKLAAPSTPEPVRAAVLRRIEAGEIVQADAILDEVREAREAAKASAAAEREAARRATLTDEQRADEDALQAKGEKGKAARDRKQEREREARQEEQRQRDAEATAAATVLVDMLGADRAAAYFARFGSGAYTAFQRAEEVAHARRAIGVAPVEVPRNEIGRSGSLFDFMRPEDRPRIEALAERIEREGLAEPPIGVRHAHNRLRPIHILEGHDTVRALVDVLRWETIPVRLAPPVDEREIAALGAADEAAGVEFTNGGEPGVKLRRKDPT